MQGNDALAVDIAFMLFLNDASRYIPPVLTGYKQSVTQFANNSGAHGKALAPEAAAAGRREGADAVGLVILQQLTAAAEQAGGILEFVYTPAETPVFFAVPDFTEALPGDVSERMVPDAAFVVAKVGVRRMEQTHAGRDVPVPTYEAMAFLNEAAPVGAPGDGLSLPREQFRLLQALLVREEQILISF